MFKTLWKMHSEKAVKQKRKLFRQRIEAATSGVLWKKKEFTGRPASLLKRDSGTGVFLGILRTF